MSAILRETDLEPLASVPYDAGIAARIRTAAQTPPNADRFTRAAHGYEHDSLCLHKATSEKMRAKMQVKMRK